MKHKRMTTKQKRMLKNILVVMLLIISFPSYTPSQVIIESDHILISNHLLSRPIECISFDGLTYTGMDGKKYSHKNYVVHSLLQSLIQLHSVLPRRSIVHHFHTMLQDRLFLQEVIMLQKKQDAICI